MRPIFLTTALVLLCSLSFSQVTGFKETEVITGNLIRITKPLRSLTPEDLNFPYVQVRNEQGRIWPEGKKPLPFVPQRISTQQQSADPALQTVLQGNPPSFNGAIVNNWPGMGYTMVNPPDPSICVGPNHVIQMINGSSGAYFKVFSKSGNQLVAQTYLDNITLKGGLGDPIALYDHMADRYVLTEFVDKTQAGSEGLVFAVSKTNDPAGQWYVYFFSTGTVFPDYPKFSVWPDAYYGTTNNFTNTYQGSSVYAFDRAKMLAGNATATVQKITLGNTSKFFSMSPVTLEGATLPPAGSGGLITYMQDDAWTTPTTDADSVGLIEFKVNFANPALTTVMHKASLATSSYKAYVCDATRGQCISQPGTSTPLEALDEHVMNQPVYRRFAGYEGIVFAHAVDKGSNIAGVRWYELRKTSADWGIHQQATYSPDNTHRFMPGICYDSYGNIGLAYNVSSSETGVYPGIRYTGRKECDPLNTMTYTEAVLMDGAASSNSMRYGDYSHLVCDPDGERFWFTAEWNNSSTWGTRIAAFTLDPCGVPPVFVCNPPASLFVTSITSNSATLNWSTVTGGVSYDVEYLVIGSNNWVNAATATTSTNAPISGLAANTAYVWRIKTNCAETQSGYANGQFTTAPVSCPDLYEVNNTLATAVPIPVGTTIQAKIGAPGDKDYYTFSNSASEKKIKITLSNLPADYDMKLYGPNGHEVKKADHNGLVDEVIIYNSKKIGAFKLYVLGQKSSTFNATQCYNLQVLLNAQNFGSEEPENDRPEIVKTGLSIYPVPAKSSVTIAFDAASKGTADITLSNGAGQTIIHKSVLVEGGANSTNLDIRSLKEGVYIIKVVSGGEVRYGRVVKN